MARPKLDIDPEQVRKLAAIDCSYEEMASILNCDPKTLSNRFSQAIKEGRDHGKMSLKRKQYEVAMGGNTTMLIWLGKQRLGQTDKQAIVQANMTSDAMPVELQDKIKEALGLLKE